MKYGVLGVYETHHRTDSGYFNIGDNIQGIAMKHILREVMGIAEKDIVELDFHQLSSYNDEYLIVPVNLFFFGCKDVRQTWFPASDKIIPVFTGVHFATDYFDEESIAYLRLYAPIGCRDEYTLRTMRKYHIPAYLAGCVTATLPTRLAAPKEGRPFLVDVSPELAGHIPKEIQDTAIYFEHEFYGEFCTDNFIRAEQLAKKALSLYANDASMVITSRLHCASPAIALGIPTIFAPNRFLSRFSWLDRLLPIYTQDEFHNIDWNPNPVHYDQIKNEMIRIIVSKIRDAAEKWDSICSVSDFFIGSGARKSEDPFDCMLERMEQLIFKQNPSSEYIIWGMTCLAQQIFNRIKINYPEARLVAVIDEYNQAVFETVLSQNSTVLELYSKIPIMATPTGAKNYILQKLEMLNHEGICIFADGYFYQGKGYEACEN